MLLLAVSTAAAESAKPRACSPGGGVLFEIDQRASGKRTTATTLLYANGAWRSRTFDTDGKLADTEQGCLDGKIVKQIVDALRTAHWTVAHTQPTCSLSPRWSIYRWKKRSVFTERACSGDALDDDSAKAVDLVEMHVVPPDLDDDDARPRHSHRGHLSQECLDNPLARGCD